MTTRSSPIPTEPQALRQRRWPWATVVGLSTLGLALSLYLVVEHRQASSNPGHALCDINDVISCSKVSLSNYAVFLGVPVAAWGVLGYLAMAAVGLWGWFSRGARPPIAVLMILSGFSALVSLALGVISKVLIGALCLFCLGTYVVNALLLIPSIALLASGGVSPSFAATWRLVADHRTRVISCAAAGAAALGLLMLLYPKYWLEASAHAAVPEPEIVLPAASSSSNSVSAGFTTGVTKDGHHWIGAAKPKVVVEEYSDYQCPYCRVAHARLRELIQKYPGHVRLVHRHFPLDNRCNPIIEEPFHPNGCYYSALVACAGEQDKFWPGNDYVFKHAADPEAIDKKRFAAELSLDGEVLHECLEKRAWNKLRPDLEAGIKLQIQGTPTFVIDGKPQTGADPRELLAPYLPKKAGEPAATEHPFERAGAKEPNDPEAEGSAAPTH